MAFMADPRVLMQVEQDGASFDCELGETTPQQSKRSGRKKWAAHVSATVALGMLAGVLTFMVMSHTPLSGAGEDMPQVLLPVSVKFFAPPVHRPPMRQRAPAVAAMQDLYGAPGAAAKAEKAPAVPEKAVAKAAEKAEASVVTQTLIRARAKGSGGRERRSRFFRAELQELERAVEAAANAGVDSDTLREAREYLESKSQYLESKSVVNEVKEGAKKAAVQATEAQEEGSKTKEQGSMTKSVEMSELSKSVDPESNQPVYWYCNQDGCWMVDEAGMGLPEGVELNTVPEGMMVSPDVGLIAAAAKVRPAPAPRELPFGEGIFAPVVKGAVSVAGRKELNQIRAGIIQKHSKVIADFVDTSDSKFGQIVLKRMFEAADKDGNGALDKQEVYDCLYDLGFKFVEAKDIDNFFKKADKDGNAVIDFEEFSSEAPKALRLNLIKLAKNNGHDLGFLV